MRGDKILVDGSRGSSVSVCRGRVDGVVGLPYLDSVTLTGVESNYNDLTIIPSLIADINVSRNSVYCPAAKTGRRKPPPPTGSGGNLGNSVQLKRKNYTSPSPRQDRRGTGQSLLGYPGTRFPDSRCSFRIVLPFGQILKVDILEWSDNAHNIKSIESRCRVFYNIC